MKRILIVLFLILNIVAKANGDTIYVSSQLDKRLISYNDSLKAYSFGLYQINIAKSIRNKQDISEGSAAMVRIRERGKKINPNIKCGPCVKELSFHYRSEVVKKEIIGGLQISYINIIGWCPDTYKKPSSVVIYKKIEIPILAVVKVPVKVEVTKIDKKIEKTIVYKTIDKLGNTRIDSTITSQILTKSN